MLKYAKIIDEKTGLCEVGMGETDDAVEFYTSIGMEQMEVEQASDGAWYVEGKVPSVPVAEIVKTYENAVQNYLDATAQAKGYDSTYTCLSYLSSTDETWHREANIFNVWRDTVWRKCHEVLNAVLAGEIQPPTVDELIAQLPEIEW